VQGFCGGSYCFVDLGLLLLGQLVIVVPRGSAVGWETASCACRHHCGTVGDRYGVKTSYSKICASFSSVLFGLRSIGRSLSRVMDGVVGRRILGHEVPICRIQGPLAPAEEYVRFAESLCRAM
jgi:hypothetical protein